MIVQRLNLTAVCCLVVCVMLTTSFAITRAQSSPAGPSAEEWNPDFFPISYWCGPPGDFVTPERFKEIAEAGFTYAMPPCGGLTPEQNKKVLDYAQAAGIKAFIHDGRMPHGFGANGEGKEKIDAIVADYANHPAFAGYFIGDEPGAGAFPALAQTVAYLREKDPKHPAYLNLYPNYCPPHGLGTPTYEAYLEAFMSQVKPAILSYDHYHFLSKSDRPGFFANLESVRASAQKYNVPFWQIVLLINHFDYRTLTDGELRWEAMQTLAYGGKGLMWFTYWRPENIDMWGEAMISSDGTRTPKYAQVRRVNKDVQTIGKHLLKAEIIRTFEVGTPGDLTNTGGDQPIMVKSPNLTIGYFSKGETERLALIANRDYRSAISAEVHIDSKGNAIKRLDKKTGEWVNVDAKKDASSGLTLTVQLDAGDADLYRWTLKPETPLTTAQPDAAVDELKTRKDQ